ncbi:uncharacterized protein J3D65DRAFT_629368 [Phyllosticta citribraziliensis]|uniref:Uncharacterized protein n=1 Tax=Phyllosticta citribraziliensis TaxID=989973 RepID=A0ABR1LJJ8_9PEZI
MVRGSFGLFGQRSRAASNKDWHLEEQYTGIASMCSGRRGFLSWRTTRMLPAAPCQSIATHPHPRASPGLSEQFKSRKVAAWLSSEPSFDLAETGSHAYLQMNTGRPMRSATSEVQRSRLSEPLKAGSDSGTDTGSNMGLPRLKSTIKLIRTPDIISSALVSLGLGESNVMVLKPYVSLRYLFMGLGSLFLVRYQLSQSTMCLKSARLRSRY